MLHVRITHIPSLLLALATALIAPARAAPGALDISLPVGTFRGVSTAQGIEKWLGIRYAQAPVGPLRFKAPVPVPNASADAGVIDASAFGNACPQLAIDLGVPFDLGAPIAEDCLFLNGGQYTTGAASQPSFDPTRKTLSFSSEFSLNPPLLGIIQRSVTTQRPIVFVSMYVCPQNPSARRTHPGKRRNYRVNTFGFLASASVAPEDLNAGLLDQRLALEFVQDNIAAFGGDPDKVTIWGQSAGAGSVEAHIIYSTSRKLFRAGIAESPVGPLATNSKTSPPASVYDEPGKPFAQLLANTGCSAGPDAIACLQAVPFDTLLSISNSMISVVLNNQLWQPSIGPQGSFAPTRASTLIEAGEFRHDVAYLAGTNLNEGTRFSVELLPMNAEARTPRESDELFETFIRALLIDSSTVTRPTFERLFELFPTSTTKEIPFATGNELFDRGEAWYTDEMFVAPRRLFFEHAAPMQDVFAYRFAERVPGSNVTLGVAHAAELPLIFSLPTGEAAVEDDFSTTMLDFWLTFVHEMNPGDNWPKYTLENRSVLQLQRDNITTIPDGD
ncbi:hypothetical protein C0993_007250 [Termitomyces sp. T159_Od127]|nr:hypothetical protein C0993_007250 [Termitomyces sp. T159_Od127]